MAQNIVTKERWGKIMRAAGFNEEEMQNWHKQLELGF